MFCLMRLEAPSLIQKTDAKKVTPAHTHRPTLGEVVLAVLPPQIKSGSSASTGPVVGMTGKDLGPMLLRYSVTHSKALS